MQDDWVLGQRTVTHCISIESEAATTSPVEVRGCRSKVCKCATYERCRGVELCVGHGANGQGGCLPLCMMSRVVPYLSLGAPKPRRASCTFVELRGWGHAFGSCAEG